NISSLVSTNGKVEPSESGVARAERSGAVKRILVQRGQRVESGQTLVELDSTDAQAELKTAEARQAAIRAEDRASIDTAIDKARLELKIAQDNYSTAVRLRDKKAGTETDVRTAKEAVDRAQVQILSLQQ